jgi:hypothetical protein
MLRCDVHETSRFENKEDVWNRLFLSGDLDSEPQNVIKAAFESSKGAITCIVARRTLDERAVGVLWGSRCDMGDFQVSRQFCVLFRDQHEADCVRRMLLEYLIGICCRERRRIVLPLDDDCPQFDRIEELLEGLGFVRDKTVSWGGQAPILRELFQHLERDVKCGDEHGNKGARCFFYVPQVSDARSVMSVREITPSLINEVNAIAMRHVWLSQEDFVINM